MSPRELAETALAVDFSRPRKSRGPVNWTLNGQRAALAAPGESGEVWHMGRSMAPEVEPARSQFLTGFDAVLRERCKREHSLARMRGGRWIKRAA